MHQPVIQLDTLHHLAVAHLESRPSLPRRPRRSLAARLFRSR